MRWTVFEEVMNRAIIWSLIALLVLYTIVYQSYFYAGFTGVYSPITRGMLNAIVAVIILLNTAFIIRIYQKIEFRRKRWITYMLLSSGIGSIHYYFKHRPDAGENT